MGALYSTPTVYLVKAVNGRPDWALSQLLLELEAWLWVSMEGRKDRRHFPLKLGLKTS